MFRNLFRKYFLEKLGSRIAQNAIKNTIERINENGRKIKYEDGTTLMEEAPPVEYSSMRKPNLASFLIQKMDSEKEYTSVMNRLRRENTTYRVLD